MGRYGKIVFCTDFSPQSEDAFSAAAEEARLHGAELTVLHVVTPGLPLLPGDDPKAAAGLNDEQIVEKVEGYIKEHYLKPDEGLRCAVALRRGHPSVEILNHLNEQGADLVVMGSQGLSGMGLVIFGSVADRVARKAPCSCLIVR